MKSPLLFAFFLIFTFSSCSKPADMKKRHSSSWQTELRIEDALTDQGCLSIPKLFSGLGAIDPQMPVLLLPQQLQFESRGAIRENFRRLIAYGQIGTVALHPFEFIQSLPIAVQNNCEELLLRYSDETRKIYKIKGATRTSLTAEAEDGEVLQYDWLSPRSITIRRRYIAYDVPCRSEREPIYVTITKLMDWREPRLPELLLTTESSPTIDPAFLQLAAEAVGEDSASLFQEGTEGRMLNLSKVITMAAMDPLPQNIRCDGNYPQPPEPEPEPAPTPPPEPRPEPVPEPDPGLEPAPGPDFPEDPEDVIDPSEDNDEHIL